MSEEDVRLQPHSRLSFISLLFFIELALNVSLTSYRFNFSIMRLFRKSAGGGLVLVNSADLEDNIVAENKRQENSTAAVEPEVPSPEPVELPVTTPTEEATAPEPVAPVSLGKQTEEGVELT